MLILNDGWNRPVLEHGPRSKAYVQAEAIEMVYA